MKIGAAIRLIAANMAIFVGLLLALLFLMSLAGDTVNFAKTFFPKNDERADLPAYQDHEKARRIYRDLRMSDSRYVPFTEWRQPQYKSENLNIDEDGYRLHRIGADNNDANAETLGFYGSSTVWGTGVNDDGTLPAQFDKITTKYTVSNYGERGYTSMQNLIDLITQINTHHEPKNAIFYGGFNDIFVHCDLALTRRLNSHGAEERIQSALDRTASKNYLYNNILAPIASITLGVVAGDPKSIDGCSNDPKRAEDVAEMMVKNYEMMHSLVQGYGGRFHLFIQPSAYFSYPRLDYLHLDSGDFEFNKRQINAVLPLVVQKLNERGSEWFTDLRSAFDGNEPFLIDHAHPSLAGNTLLAKLIKDKLDP